MSADAFRFVHATNLRLDQPLTGVGAVAPDERPLLEDATLTAFDRVIEACVQHRADFLLLTGDCFEHQTGTLRGRIQMQRGLERLADRKVPVCIIPGSLDPPGSWRRGITLPANTTLFSSDEDEPVSISRDGRRVACIAPVAMASSDEAAWRAAGPSLWRNAGDAFRIGLIGAGTPVQWNGPGPEPTGGPGTSTAAVTLIQQAIVEGVDFLALGEGAERFTVSLARGVAHDPGSPQGLNAAESGAKGCSLVEVDADGEVEIKFVPTAPVRWMSLAVDAPTAVDASQLAERMALAALECEPYSTDELWLVRWTVNSADPAWSTALLDARTQAELWDRVERELRSAGGPRRRHSLAGLARRAVDRSEAETPGGRELFGEFVQLAEGAAAGELEALRRDVAESWPQANWVRHVRQALQKAQPHDVARRAADWAEAWLV